MEKRKRILVVEDDHGWQVEIAEALPDYELVMAGSVRDAQLKVDQAVQEELPFDLVILDLMLSETTGIDSGLAVLSHLNKQIPQAPCIVFTVQMLPMSKARTLWRQYNIFEGLEKPGDYHRLSGVVRAALDAASSEERSSSVIKILFLAANPSDTVRLRLDEEGRAIDLALRQSEFRDVFEVKQHWAVRVKDIQELFLRHKPDIVHFCGHGSQSQGIFLEDDHGVSHPVSSSALARLFSVLKDNIRCVMLNACYSESQAQAIAEHIDCVIGMSKQIGDQAAISFATAFYQTLGYGRDIQTAFDSGCLQIDLENLGEQDTPKLIAQRCDPKEIVLIS